VSLRKLRDELVRTHPSITDPDAAIARGEVVVDGRVVTNPASLVPVGAAIALRKDQPLRGEAKLKAALAAFDVAVSGRMGLDVGAAAVALVSRNSSSASPRRPTTKRCFARPSSLRATVSLAPAGRSRR
jgi:hypothetical protein